MASLEIVTWTISGDIEKLKGKPSVLRKAVNYSGFSIGGGNGLFSKASFPGLASLPAAITKAAMQCANNSLSEGSWANNKVVLGHLSRCQEHFKIRFHFPMKENEVMTLVLYLREVRRVKSATIENALSAIRIIHLTKGMFISCLRPEVVKLMLRGMSHEDLRLDRAANNRLPVTLEVLVLLEAELEDKEDWSDEYKSMFWSVATLAFFGAFRVGELLSKKANSIDMDQDLLLKDVKLVKRMVGKTKKEILEVNLKSPKEAKSNVRGIKVEVFSNKSRLCPIKAFLNYKKVVGVKNLNSAAFRLPRLGLAYRHERFNKDLKVLLSGHLPYGSITGHSFRAGLSTLLGRAGFGDEEIKALGRWSGESFLRYIKSGRMTRARNSDKICDYVLSSINNL